MYRRENKNKIIVSLILVAVLTISIGYAAFTNTLKIDSGATVTPNSATFDIDFSTSSNSVVTDNITPTLTGGLTAQPAVIDNSTSPTITNLSVNFTEPGQKAVYSFYAYNNGEYLAYLNSINFLNAAEADSFISCVGDEGTSYVEDACAGINVTVQVGKLTVSKTKEGIYSHTLDKKTSEEVIVTIEYVENSERADGPITVKFGDITLVYTTLNSEKSSNLFTTSLEIGGLAGASGENYAATNRIRFTDYIEIEPNKTYNISFSSDYVSANSHIFDADYNRLASFTSNVTTPENAKYVKISFRKSDDSDLTEADILKLLDSLIIVEN